ncbi:MAG TPA: signal peptidase II [Candidatus Binataceae bacterium]|nr:signal peptidase II [Candidatus Binataceae bacterium]
MSLESTAAAARHSPAETSVNVKQSAWTFGRLLAMVALITVPVLVLDQVSKLYVSSHFRLFETYPLVPGWLDCTYTLNPGAAFSLFATMPAGFREAFFIGLSAAAVVVMTVLIARRSTATSTAFACAVVLAGTIGNLIDRVARGRVIDFIYVHHDAFHYPVFNVADAAITIGVAMILLFSWLHERAAARIGPG